MESGVNELLEININRITEEEFLQERNSIPVLFSRDMNPRSYYIIDINGKKQWLIDQEDVGLENIPYMLYNKLNLLFVATTFNLYIIDYIKNKIVFEYDLITPCVDFFANNEFVFIICEGELLHFSIKLNRIVKYDIFSYALENLSLTTDKAIITLENGETIVIK